MILKKKNKFLMTYILSTLGLKKLICLRYLHSFNNEIFLKNVLDRKNRLMFTLNFTKNLKVYI